MGGSNYSYTFLARAEEDREDREWRNLTDECAFCGGKSATAQMNFVSHQRGTQECEFRSDSLYRARNARLCCLKEHDMESCNSEVTSRDSSITDAYGEAQQSRILLAWTFELTIDVPHLGLRLHGASAALSFRRRKLMGRRGNRPLCRRVPPD